MDERRHPESLHPSVATAAARKLAGRFEILRWLGEGGMGTVYLARDEKFDRRVAVKVLLGGELTALTRFKQEFRTLADISHPNLIVLHELLCDDATWLFTMQYVEGRDFLTHVSLLEGRDAPTLLEVEAHRLREGVRRSDHALLRCPVRDDERLRRVLRQLTDAVSSLHGAGKLHLDLKPSNVLVGSDDHVTVLDFGLARDLKHSSLVSTQRLLGTPAYMAPEHAEGKRFEPASDWYAVGVMLYEALTGRLPFEGPIAHILLSKTHRDPEPPSSICREVPPELDALCMRLLVRNPSQRAAGEEIMATLGNASSQRGTIALRPLANSGEPFVGRGQVLAGLLARSHSLGEPRVVLLHGSSGVGKTTLAQRFLDDLSARPRTLVLRGACYEREAVPYKAFDGIVDALIEQLESLPPLELGAVLPRHAHTLARLFPAFALLSPGPIARRQLDDDEPELGRARAFRAFAELFGRLSDQHEVVLFIDDLHWSDLDSALLLRALFEGAEPVPLLLVGTYRSEEAVESPLLGALRELALSNPRLLVEDAEVGSLETSEAETLAHELLIRRGLDSPAMAAQIAGESHGVPLFIQELVRHVAHGEGAPARRISLTEAISERVASLPASAGELLEVLAIAGGPVAQRVALRAAGLAAGEGAALHTLRVAGLAKSRGARPEDALETAHDRIRAVITRGLAPERRIDVHTRLLAALEREPHLDDEQLYMHSLGAGRHERALQHAERAAARAREALASHRSTELYRAALELLSAQAPHDGGRRALLLEGLADAQATGGRSLDAGQAYLDAALLSPAAALPALERKAAEQLLRGGDLARGTKLLERVLERVGVSYPKSARTALAALAFERARLFTRGISFVERAPEEIPASELELLASLKVALGVYWLVEPVRGALFATLYLRHALDAGHPRHVLRGLETEAAYVALIGGAKGETRAGELYQAARALTQKIGSASTRSGYKLAEAGFHAIYGRKQASSECARVALASANPHGVSWEHAYARFHLYQNALYIGGRAGLADEVAECVRDAHERRDRFSAATLLPMLALTRLMADEPERAHEALATMQPLLSAEVFSFLHVQELIWSALTYQYAGEPEQALALYAASSERYGTSGMPRLSTWRLLHQWGVMLAHLAALAKGLAREPHMRAVRRGIRALEREQIGWPLPFAAVGRAALHQLLGEERERDVQLARAIRQSEALGYTPFEHLFARSAALFARAEERVAEHDAALRALGIAAPARWQRTWAPCLAPGPGKDIS